MNTQQSTEDFKVNSRVWDYQDGFQIITQRKNVIRL